MVSRSFMCRCIECFRHCRQQKSWISRFELMVKKASSGKKTPEKKRPVSEKRKLQITRKAAKLFMKNGYAQTSMRQISKETGIDISNLYYFIKSKEDILFRVFEMLHLPLVEVLEKQGVMNIDDPEKQLRSAIRGMLEFGWDYEGEALLMYRESKSLPKELRKIIMERENHFVSQIEEILKKGIDKKVFQIKDTAFTANMIAFELTLRPMRSWNLKSYSKEQYLDLVEDHIMNTVLS